MTEGYRKARLKVEMDRAHREALAEQAEHIREGVRTLLAGTGFELDVDRWGSEGVVLRHFAPGDYRYDYEIPLEAEQ